jgi:hypothetical protein
MQRLLSFRRLVLLGGVAALAVLFVGHRPARTADLPSVDRAALERTRDTVRMLDDLYKGYVVGITETYVKARERTPAAKVTKQVFAHMSAKGWHKARLVDATGDPVNKANAPATEFEKRAVARLKAGKSYYEEVATQDARPVLRAATVVPVVMKQCMSCHPGVKEGDLMGAIVYEVPIR